MKTSQWVRNGAIAFFAAFVCLILLAVIFALFDFISPVDEIILDGNALILDTHRELLSLRFIVDTLFVICWLVGWIGLYHFLAAQDKRLSVIVLVIGILGPLFDFGENGISWVLIGQSSRIGMMSENWINFWLLIRPLSYLLPYVATIILGLFMSRKVLRDKITSILFIIGSIFGIFGLYFDALYIPAILWWTVWLILLGVMLMHGKDVTDS
jgi:hypothetical protein